MDTFMDKLAQKFTAQEMIKANSAADAEEMKRLRQQVEEYDACLKRMQDVCGQVEQTAVAALAKIDSARVDRAEVSRLVDAGIDRMKEITQDTGLLEILRQQLEELQTALSGTEEAVHRECVRTYRNVQAVVTEESSKQADNINTAVNGMKGRLGGILGVSVAALVVSLFSLAGIVFQILVWLHVI